MNDNGRLQDLRAELAEVEEGVRSAYGMADAAYGCGALLMSDGYLDGARHGERRAEELRRQIAAEEAAAG